MSTPASWQDALRIASEPAGASAWGSEGPGDDAAGNTCFNASLAGLPRESYDARILKLKEAMNAAHFAARRLMCGATVMVQL